MLAQTTAISNETFRVVRTRQHVPTMARSARETSGEADSLDQTMRLMGAMISYPRNAEIFGQGEPAEFVYKVNSGSVRTYKILNDGRRQIGGFHLPGDIFGLQFGENHALSAEAITDTKILIVKRVAFNALAGHNCR